VLALLCAAIAIPFFFAFGGVHAMKEAAHAVGLTGEPAGEHEANGAARDEPGDDAGATDEYWNQRLTYPTGDYNEIWLRRAAAQAENVPVAVPAGQVGQFTQVDSGGGSGNGAAANTGFGLSGSNSPSGPPLTSSFIGLGPKPENMNGCSGCYNYTTTEGRVNAIAVDPTTTTNGSIVAYLASVGGGVWKTTNCCSASTTWTVTTDNPLISDISIDSIAIDPNNHNTIYAGTGDLNYGSFSMGSQGILKSTDAGATWTVLGSSVFGPAYSEPAGNFPQYDSVGKVRVDPNNSNNVVAGTKKGLFFSYDAGNTWAGPCTTNSFTTQRQDITGLELTNMGGGVTRILAAVGVRGFASTVQYDLGSQGANGIYSGTMGTSGCPSFTSIASNSNGFVFGTAVTGSAYTTGANMNAGTGNPYVSATSGNQLSRVDIAVAPSNPNVIYAVAGSIAANSNSSCGNTNGCQIGAWVSTNGGTSWSFMAGSAGGALRNCTGGQGDYPQNWYDQAVTVDPNNADRVFFDTTDIWFATRTGTSWNDLSCVYSFSGSAGPVHADQHAITFLPGSSSIMLIGNDGGVNGTTNANTVSATVDPTWFNMDSGLNTIEFYNADIWGGAASTPFAASTAPWAVGGAQDNMDSTVHFTSAPTGPVQWQGNVGGDGFWTAIDGKGGYFYVSNNSGALHRCTANCANTGAVYGGDIRSGSMTSDTQSFVEPFDLFRGNIGGTGNAECGARCNHIMVGTVRVWENTAADTGTTWTQRGPATLVKGTLGNRSFINQLHYAPQNQTLGIVATNDGNIQVLYGLGGTTTAVNLTASNVVLPNRPMLDARLDPGTQNTVANPFIGYAAVGGFSANTPSTPGHVYRFVCNVNCATFTWQDKSGNLPDIPVDSIMPNPNFPQQVFAGTDFGLYFTNDITAPSPTWYRFQNGLPNVMIWSMSVDRGNSTLVLATRSRGAYAWPLPTSAIKQAQSITFGSLADKTFGDADFGLTATASSGLAVTYAASGSCTVSGSTVHITGGGSCTITASQAGNIDFNPAADVPQTFSIARASQSITFPAIGDKTFGDPDFAVSASASSGLDVSFSAGGNCSVTGGMVHLTGAGSCTITASQGGDANYAPATDVSRAFSIAKSGQTIEFTTTDKTFGDADFEITGTATSGLTVSLTVVSGNCSIDSATSPANVHISGAGMCTITASQAGNDNYNAADDVTRTFSIGKASQTITFGSLPDKTYGDAAFDVSASASSGLDVTFTTQDDCWIDGTTVHITGAGTCTVTASQAGNGDYNPAPDVAQTFTIAKADQTIDFAPLADKTYGDADFVVSASSSSGLLVAFSVDGQCVLIGGQVHITGSGSCTVTASQAGNVNYNAAPDKSRTFSIAKADQSIDFAALSDKTYGDPDFGVSATASSGLPVSFATSGDCVLVYGQVDITGAGSCTVTASQGGDDNYNAAPDVNRTFSIAKENQTIAFAVIGDATFGDGDFEIDATATSGLTVSLSATGPCTLSSAIAPASVHITGAGSCAITASQGGDDNYNAATDVVRSFSINKASQTINFAALGDKTYGDADFNVAATASSGLGVSFAAAGNCTLVGTTVHITGAGSCTVTASQAGNGNYNPAPDVPRTFAIAKENQTISFAALANKTLGDPDFTVSATASSGLTVSFSATGSCTVSGGTVHITGPGDCTVTASQAGDANYNPAPDAPRTFTVLYPWTGFFQPVDNTGVLNVAQAGSAIPVKFSLGGDRGLAIFAAGYPISAAISCTSGEPQDDIEQTVTAGQSSLSYGSGQYTYVWKTDKQWASSCRRLTVKLIDGSSHTADFLFKK
jgi:hypothetical protein